MDVDLGMGLGDDLGGFDGFDYIFASNPNPSDLFKISTFDDTQHDSQLSGSGESPRSTRLDAEHLGLGADAVLNSEWERSQPRDAVKSELTNSGLIFATGKPRARKRHEEDEALEAAESAQHVVKRQAADPAKSNGGDFTRTSVFDAVSSGDLAERSPSSRALVSPGTTSDRKATLSVFVGHSPGSNGPVRQPHAHQQSRPPVAAPGGAIKIKKDITSVVRPRISVFMSKSARSERKSAFAAGMPPDASPRSRKLQQGAGASPRITTSARGPSLMARPRLARISSVQHVKDHRAMVPPARSQAEQQVLKSNPSVVAIGSCHIPSTGGQRHDEFAIPRLHRASSVGALRIAGSGDVVSRSPVLSATGSIIESAELSDQVGSGGRRRNLVCKVFGSGSPYQRPSAGPH